MEEEKKSSKRNVLIIIGVLLATGVIFLGLYSAFTSNHSDPILNKSSAQKLSDSIYANYAYKVFPGQMSSDAQTAIAGFDVQTQNNPDGSTNVTLFAKKQGYITQEFALQPGQSLYFIETSRGDDSTDYDSSLIDDRGIVVDSSGNMVQG